MKNKEMRSRLNIYMPNELFKELTEYADMYGISKSQLACFLIKYNLKDFCKSPKIKI